MGTTSLQAVGRPTPMSTIAALSLCFLCLLLTSSSLAKPPPGYVKQPDNDEHPAKYEFGYEVNDGHGSHQGHEERRDGELAEGRYFVDLPDGSTQTVSYTADDWGFHPLVSYTSSSKTSTSSAQIALGEKAVAALRSGQTGVTKLQPVSRVIQDASQQQQQQVVGVPVVTPQPVVPVVSVQPVTTLHPVQQQQQQIVLPVQQQQQQVVVPVRPQLVQPQIVQPVQAQLVQPVQPQLIQPVQPQLIQPVQAQVVQPVVNVQPQIVQPVPQQQVLLAGVTGQGQAAASAYQRQSYQQAGAGVSTANQQLGRFYQPRLLQGAVSSEKTSGYRLAEEVNSLVSSTATPLLVHHQTAAPYAVLPSAAPLVQVQQGDEEEYRETSEQRIDFNAAGQFGDKITGSSGVVQLVTPTAATLIQQEEFGGSSSRSGLGLRPIVVADHVVTPSPSPTPLSPIVVADYSSASSAAVVSSSSEFVTTPRPVTVTVTSAGSSAGASSATADTVIITPRPESVKLRPAAVKEEGGEDYSSNNVNSLPLVVSTPVPVIYANQGGGTSVDEELHAAINALDDEVDVQEARRQEKLRAEHQVQLIKQALAETDARIQEQEFNQARLRSQIDDASTSTLSAVVKAQIPVVKYQYVQQIPTRQQQQLFVVYGGRVQPVDKEALTKLPLFQQENRQVVVKDEIQGSYESGAESAAKVSVKQLLEAEKIAEVSSSTSTILQEVEKPAVVVDAVRPVLTFQQQQPYVTVPVTYQQPLVPAYSQLVPVVKDYHYQQPYNNYFHHGGSNNKLQQQQFLSKDFLLYHGGERYGVPRQRIYPTTRLILQAQPQQQQFRYLAAPNLGLKKPLLLTSTLYNGAGGGRWRLQQGGGGATRNQSQLRKLCIEYGGFKPPIVPSKQIEEDLELVGGGDIAGVENKD